MGWKQLSSNPSSASCNMFGVGKSLTCNPPLHRLQSEESAEGISFIVGMVIGEIPSKACSFRSGTRRDSHVLVVVLGFLRSRHQDRIKWMRDEMNERYSCEGWRAGTCEGRESSSDPWGRNGRKDWAGESQTAAQFEGTLGRANGKSSDHTYPLEGRCLIEK